MDVMKKNKNIGLLMIFHNIHFFRVVKNMIWWNLGKGARLISGDDT